MTSVTMKGGKWVRFGCRLECAHRSSTCLRHIVQFPELFNPKLQELDEVSEARAAMVSTLKSTTRSHPPATFHGHTDDHGQKAQSWLYSVQLYYQLVTGVSSHREQLCQS